MKRNITFAVAGIILLCWLYIIVELFTPLPASNKPREIEIPKGATFNKTIEIFSKENLIRNKSLFLFIGRITGLDRKIRAGYYPIHRPMSQFDVFRMLKKGQIIEYRITILEGDSLRETAEKLSEKGITDIESFMRLASNKDFLSLHKIDAPTLEGYLFPDTYKIPKGMPLEDVVGMMISRMRQKYSGELVRRASELGLSEREVLTLASIIEKEATVDIEKPLISAVYHNRLKKGIPLQADPTSIYGVKRFGEKITEKDLKRRTPYNTYIIKGLPPGPIASPGIKSIIAALYPADVPYMYFVSNNDGTHTFSTTLKEHLLAVKSSRERKNNDKP